MDYVTSADGTRIAFDRLGQGPLVILLTGGLDDGSENAPLAAELATGFTVINYQRRGRGSSGDNQPYAVEREIEDIEALIGDGTAFLFGVSSGGALALEAAAAGLPIGKVAVYEVPYLMDDFYSSAADAIAEIVPDTHRETLAGQGHVADPKPLATTLNRFFRS